MIRSENNQGFTLIEVLLSMVIMGAVITALMSSQSVVLFSVKTISHQFSRLLLAKNIIYQTRLHGKTSAESKSDDPPTTFKYSQKKASGAIGKKFKDIYREQMVFEWEEDGRKRSDTIVSFIFKPKEKEEET